MGPSTTCYALNEKHIKGFKNMSRVATSLYNITRVLPAILDNNPEIDTLLLNHGRFQFQYHDKKNTTNIIEQNNLQFFRQEIPLIFYDYKSTNWNKYLSNVNFYGAILNPDFRRIIESLKERNSIGEDYGYSENKRENLHSSTAEWSIKWYNDRHQYTPNDSIYNKEWIVNNCQENDIAIKRAISICKQRNVTVVLLFTPLYHFEKWCPINGFCDYMKDYPDDTLIADYEDFEFPDDSYYGDVHHLNSKGADYFTSYLAKNGIKVQKLHEWLREKGY